MKRKKKNKSNERKSTLDVFPLRSYDEEVEAYELEDGSYLDIVEKKSQDLENILEDDLQYEMLQMAKFYKLYKGDIKIVALNFPVNTEKQRHYLEKKREKTNNEVKKKWLLRSINELAKQDIYATKREYYLFLFSSNKEEHEKNKKQVLAILGAGGQGSLIRLIDKEKKHRIIFKLNNMNTLVMGEDYEEYTVTKKEKSKHEGSGER